jgi:hypothetical protein
VNSLKMKEKNRQNFLKIIKKFHSNFIDKIYSNQRTNRESFIYDKENLLSIKTNNFIDMQSFLRYISHQLLCNEKLFISSFFLILKR